jgi:hypothetical protein
MKPSEIFEGENSSLRKTFNEAVENEEIDMANDIVNHFFERGARVGKDSFDYVLKKLKMKRV